MSLNGSDKAYASDDAVRKKNTVPKGVHFLFVCGYVQCEQHDECKLHDLCRLNADRTDNNPTFGAVDNPADKRHKAQENEGGQKGRNRNFLKQSVVKL